ncbi:discoidin domain-containing protein [Actinoplanes sp. NPDC048967]|uniref:discoidin domain-containing protein n=1 Tax=Actinoplanes sp. NPDC048967 TaxID=3155269 RepID=UPI0033F9D599
MAKPAEQRPGDRPELPTRIPFAGPHPGTFALDRPAPGPRTGTRTPLARATGFRPPRVVPAPAPQPQPVAAEVVPPRRPRSWILPAAAAVLVLVAGALWWSHDRADPPAPQAAPGLPPAVAPTMRITAPGSAASAGVGSDKATTGSAASAGSASAGEPASSGGSPAVSRPAKPAGKPTAAVNTTGRNLALGSRATASSVERSSWGPAYAIDNDTTTRWSSGFSDPQWLTVDLGKSWEISEVLLRWENAHATAYRVELSTDGRKWKQVFSTTDSAGGDVTVRVPKLPARLIRMYGTARSTDYGYSLLEIEVR